jgi:hypothetical protein
MKLFLLWLADRCLRHIAKGDHTSMHQEYVLEARINIQFLRNYYV